jgi:hypothetical protein
MQNSTPETSLLGQQRACESDGNSVIEEAEIPSKKPTWVELRHEALIPDEIFDTMAPAARFGWQPFGKIERKSSAAVPGTPAADLQAIRLKSEENDDMGPTTDDKGEDENEKGEDDDMDDGAQASKLYNGVTPFCDGEVPTALSLAMAELHQGEASKLIPMKRWMKTAGELSAVNVVAGRMQDVYKSIHAVRMTMMMKTLADVGSPVRVTLSQQPFL